MAGPELIPYRLSPAFFFPMGRGFNALAAILLTLCRLMQGFRPPAALWICGTQIREWGAAQRV